MKSPQKDPRMHEVEIGSYVGIEGIEILWVSKGKMRMFIIFMKTKRWRKRGGMRSVLMDAETMPSKRITSAEKHERYKDILFSS